jgi:prepilin-type processing-associated H-X9-DG protein/prepilin-type N-terminal cleavage/methylation domain-containing protein
MRRRGFTIWELFIVVAIILILAVFVFPLFLRPTPAYRSICQSNQKQAVLAFKQYIQDYNEFYPVTDLNDAAVSVNAPLGWADALDPYLKSTQVFWCPLRIKDSSRDGHKRKPNENEYTDYWFNRRMSKMRESSVELSATTVLLGEGNDGTDATNARYSLSTLPAAWRTNINSPAYRHLEGANYAFVDGHIKWLKPNKVTDKKPNGEVYTFAIK